MCWDSHKTPKIASSLYPPQLMLIPPPEKMSTGLMSVTVSPVRLLQVFFFMLLAWPFAFTASLGHSEFVIEPQSWWRRCVC
uniref:Uncharacterized protein n=1 Tax=Monopterus albus TaxID=43700 RepID=A0A3Q3ITJ9_MONAL